MANPKYAASDKPVPVAELVDTLSDGTKVKRRVPRMRACNEKDAKGKLCAGHLKRWYFFGDEVKRKVPRMRACNEKDAKGKLCPGHLKRWYFFGILFVAGAH